MRSAFRPIRLVLYALVLSGVAIGCSEAATRDEDGISRIESSAPTLTTAEPPATTTSVPPPATSTTTTTTTLLLEAPFLSGAEVLATDGYSALAGRRVGLIANQTSLLGDRRLIDELAAAPNVDLVAIFAPEHGVDGVADAGETIVDGTDEAAEIPVYSLYGSSTSRKPSASQMEGLDVLVFDLQDVGTRFYTYISTMGLAMQAASEHDVHFIVLDRPNPQGGLRVEGFVRDESQESFVSQYPIPSLYGMTAGELALAIRGENWLRGTNALDLTVIEMSGWARSDTWTEIGQPWIPPSPGLPDLASTYAYPGTVLIEATSLSYGRGTYEPFAIAGASWIDADQLAEELNAADLAGVRFEPTMFVPEVLPIAPTPRYEGVEQAGVRIVVTDEGAFEPVRTGVHILVAAQRQASALGRGSIVDREAMFDLLAGTTRLRTMLDAGATAEEIAQRWQAEITEFLDLRRGYLLYE